MKIRQCCLVIFHHDSPSNVILSEVRRKPNAVESLP
jgi:hypothetical protein